MRVILMLHFLLPAITIAALLLGVNGIIKGHQQEHQEQVSLRLLGDSEAATSQLAEALNDTERSKVTDCSPASLHDLRRIRQKYTYVDDIGLVRDNRIVCTADWGSLSENIPLPSSPYLTPGGYLIYQFREDNRYMRKPQSVSVIHDYAVMSSALTFADFLNTPPDLYIVLATHDQKKEFYSRGQKRGSSSDHLNPLFHVGTRQCSEIRDLCVTTLRSDGGLRALSRPLVALLILAGLVTGFLLASFATNQVKARKSLENRFIRAVNRSELYMEYQPIVQVSDRRVVSFEALVRWQDSFFGKVSPELFIGLASRLKLYHRVSSFVLQQSLNEMQFHLRENPGLRLSLNVGDEEINDGQYIRKLSDECRVRGIKHDQIKLEITERASADTRTIAAFCRSARQQGFVISLDDFGTGTSNIAWLSELDFDEVKIDRLFVSNIVDVDKRKILLTIVDGLQKTGKQLVFEGVETDSQFEFIRSLNPDYLVQGWYTGKPAGISEIAV